MDSLTNLESLGLVRTRITDQGIGAVAAFKNLRSLNLDYTDVGDAGLALLTGLTQLEDLSLDSANAGNAAASSIKEFKHLKRLNLYHTLIDPEGYQAIRSALPGCKIVWEEKSAGPMRRRG